MKTLLEQIQAILTPKGNPGLVKNDRIYALQPLFPVHQIFEIAEDMDIKGKEKILSFLEDETTVIFNGIIYIANKGLKFQGRLKEIMILYNNHLKEIIGNKKALINLYETIPMEDIANLTEDHVIFCLKKPLRGDEKVLAAIRYVPPYQIHFENKTYYMPACTVAIPIDSGLALGNPEIIAENGSNFYEHPFVYRDNTVFGQRLCLGSYYNSTDARTFKKLRFANSINALIKQSVQILVTGYNRRVTPANGHLTSEKYKKYLIKPDNWDDQQFLE